MSSLLRPAPVIFSIVTLFLLMMIISAGCTGPSPAPPGSRFSGCML